MNDVRWSVDVFTFNRGVIFSYGWFFNERKDITELSFIIRQGDLKEKSIVKLDYGKIRNDVGQCFPKNNYSMHSGFLLYNAMRSEEKIVELSWHVTYADGTSENVLMPEKVFMHDTVEPLTKKDIIKQYNLLWDKCWPLIKSQQFKLLFDKVYRYVSKIPKKNLHNASDIKKIINKEGRNRVIFVLDHDLGGGANLYRNRLIKERLSLGFSIITLSYNIASLSYKIVINYDGKEDVFGIPRMEYIYSILNFINIDEVIYNTGVSFVRPQDIPGFLIGLKLKSNAPITILAHDLFPLCPSHFLINDKGVYCNIPESTRCKSCLRNNTFGFTSLYKSGDIDEWRSKWGQLINSADKIVFFSKNTCDLYRRVYPQITEVKTIIAPHQVDYFPCKANIKNKEKLVIGVVGQIGHHKGSAIVKSLAEEICKNKIDVEIVVVGAIDVSCPTDVVRQTGPYKHSELPALLEKNGVNVILFPSIWPETFSYVVQEMIELGYPVASFNLGAPVERLIDYKNGMILSSMSASDVLKDLLSFFHKLNSLK
ncbi:glycosyltransferase [Dickeya chrysanthemi]|uniref:glycosyltransferase n=1 Tax=Dickeya chrysanthemi TaxID=556 RepID=UPI0025A1FF59|nr:glycosyltransferase [Dickeya chrysanthemi]WJM84521.1 glycosyltransferase [Dickeya chrysanthemi]